MSSTLPTCAVRSAQLAISPDSVARLNRGMEDAATDYTGMADAEIFLSDYKEYEIGSAIHLMASRAVAERCNAKRIRLK